MAVFGNFPFVFNNLNRTKADCQGIAVSKHTLACTHTHHSRLAFVSDKRGALMPPPRRLTASTSCSLAATISRPQETAQG